MKKLEIINLPRRELVLLRGWKLKICQGFTLVEAIVAMGVIAVGFTGSLVLLSKSTSQANSLKDRVIAAHLAEEGIELIRNIRDTNWLNPGNPGWRSGLNDTNNGLVNYDESFMTNNSDQNSWCLNWNGTHYKHAAAPNYICNTSFKRHMELATKSETISGQNVDYLEIKSVVEWREKSFNRNITVVDHLYDWK